MELTTETQLRCAAAALGAAILVVIYWTRLGEQKQLASALALLAAILGGLTFYNFGAPRQYHHEGFLNLHEHFHYQLGSKFFPELGYNGLYAASMGAQYQSNPDAPWINRFRDLRTNQEVPAEASYAALEEVVQHFSTERWESFVADHHFLMQQGLDVSRVRLDHGYNGTPAYTSVLRLFTAWIPVGPVGSYALAALDILLILTTFALIHATYGGRVTCLCLALFGLGFGWRYMYVGAVLRFDWLAAIVGAICALERRRPALAGVLFGYATAARVFPVLLLAGPALLALRALSRGERPRWVLPLAGGFSAMLAVAFVAGCLAGRGTGAWAEFAENMALHWQLTPWTRVGLDVLPHLDFSRLADALAGGDRAWRQILIPDLSTGRQIAGIALKALFLVLFVASSWRATLGESAALGIALVFTLSPAGSYYWIMLMLMPLAGARKALLGPLLLATLLYAHELVFVYPEANPPRSFALSIGVAFAIAFWLLASIRSRAHCVAPASAAALVALVAGVAHADPPQEQPAPETVVLMHGLAQSHLALWPLQSRLSDAGYDAHNVPYPSTELSAEEVDHYLHEFLLDCCLDKERLHFVTHSLGGILIRAYLAAHETQNLGRVVMLAPPNHGSELVDLLGDSAPFRWALGPLAAQLGTGPQSLPNRLPPPDFEVGVIAGTRKLNPVGAIVIPGESDGTVSVESTKLERMTDFITLPASHSLLPLSSDAADQTLHFLRQGRFDHPDDTHPTDTDAPVVDSASP